MLIYWYNNGKEKNRTINVITNLLIGGSKMDKENKITVFPKGFFKKERSTIDASDALKDAIPYKWSNKVPKVKKQKTSLSIKETN